ncbi:hypothetical protein CHS0354_007664 [Potamilus streckersoni]|uniref:Uncharacterized protein n=1 Tax=Potamilus streckersoni TaxID=2493646 RepID=A0AAE0VWI8_9BIVA|nr:hypothetical protein CHS0354_007664 [Potamilus streckersoni]
MMLPLDKDNYIRIATIDPDGDHVACSMATYVEGGIASNNPLPNVTVTKEAMNSKAIYISLVRKV